jgi:hypothetical protein
MINFLTPQETSRTPQNCRAKENFNMPNRRGRPTNNPSVSISLSIPVKLLEEIDRLEGKTTSEKIRNTLLLGLNQATHCERDEGSSPARPTSLRRK